jgi:hypothetical protein
MCTVEPLPHGCFLGLKPEAAVALLSRRGALVGDEFAEVCR